MRDGLSLLNPSLVERERRIRALSITTHKQADGYREAIKIWDEDHPVHLPVYTPAVKEIVK